MRISIVGYGAMGRLIKEEARAGNIEVASVVDPSEPGATHAEISEKALADVDVAIDFSVPTAALGNIRSYCAARCSAVIGTTGWYEQRHEVEALVKDAGIGLLWASNFALGVHAYFRIVEFTSKLFDKLEDFDVWGSELHHVHKADSPSGTARTLADILVRNISRKEKVVFDRLERRIDPSEIHFSSLRGGAINFEHTIGFGSESESVTIQHAARDRRSYARGALQAAAWLEQQGAGFFGIDDYLSEVLNV